MMRRAQQYGRRRSTAAREGAACLLLALGWAINVGTAAAQYADEAPKTSEASEGSSPWRVTCEKTAEGARGTCQAVQAVVSRRDRRRVIRVAVRRPAGSDEAAMMVTVPVRTFLPPGTTLRVDGDKLHQTPFQICDRRGCYAGLPLDDEAVEALRHGKTLAVEFYNAARKKIVVRFSLQGFAGAFDEAG